MPSQITSVRCKYSIGRKKSRRHLAVWVQPHLSRRCPTCPFTAATPHLKPSGLASRRLGGHVPHDSASTLIHQAERDRTASLIHLPTTQKFSCFHHDGIFLQHPSPGRAQQEKLGTSSDLWGSRPIAWAIALPPPSSPSLALSAWLSLLICPGVYLCLFSRQAVCSGGSSTTEVLTARGCAEDTPGPFLSLIRKVK